MTDIIDPSDTATWLPLDALAPGFDANRAPLSRALDGRTVTIVDARGTRIVHRFGPDRVHWDYTPGEGDPVQPAAQSDGYQAFDVADELVYVQLHHDYHPDEAVSIVLDLRSGWALTVITAIGAEHDAPRVGQAFVAGRIEEVTEEARPGAEPAAPHPTRELLGRRVLWEYSPVHAYEHVYLSPQWYTWQCLAGPERGLADTDACSMWRIRPGIYVFAWREKVIPCASVTVADHRDAHALRSHGVLFGLDESGTERVHFTFGARGRLLSDTVHPAAYDPAALR